jgi:hypothetical protein
MGVFIPLRPFLYCTSSTNGYKHILHLACLTGERKLKRMKLQEIILSGILQGRLWYGQECEKQFREKFTLCAEPFSHEWNGLRDALLHITNDGDFMSCSILFGQITVVYGGETPSGKYQELRKYADLEPCKAICDLFA